MNDEENTGSGWFTLRCGQATNDLVRLTCSGQRVYCNFCVEISDDGDMLSHSDSFHCSEIPKMLVELRKFPDMWDGEGTAVESTARCRLVLYKSTEGFVFGFEARANRKNTWGVILQQEGVNILLKYLEEVLAGATPSPNISLNPAAEEQLVPRLGL